MNADDAIDDLIMKRGWTSLTVHRIDTTDGEIGEDYCWCASACHLHGDGSSTHATGWGSSSEDAVQGLALAVETGDVTDHPAAEAVAS